MKGRRNKGMMIAIAPRMKTKALCRRGVGGGEELHVVQG